jgi:hypothetical protein
MNLYCVTLDCWAYGVPDRLIAKRQVIVEAEAIHNAGRIAESVASRNWNYDYVMHRSAYRITLPAELKIDAL